ncbi:AH receptor-interacting protein [Lucilia sericata]|uniref:AH receptor-interacting protein n=1 Tax=Lucilia sericata TaxID=13632 RepID=UPI0018A8333B|nr:AH receptor-interacting protein [Lucilia sericata]
MDTNIENALIQKKIISPGKEFMPLKEGTRVKFHFQTRKLDGTVLDDSRKLGRPMELVLGKKFKLEVWEVIVQKMALNEVAKFTVNKKLVSQYPFIAKTLRDVGKKVEERRHCCGMTLQNEGLGYKDLDDLLSSPCDLEFIIDLFSIEKPEDYKKDTWQMSDEEKLKTSLKLKDEGNEFYKQKQFTQAEECYRTAVGLLEQLMLKEKPHDVEWNDLAKLKVPVLLNYAQCRLLAQDYYAVIEHCNDVLQLDPDNVKALFRRAKAHVGAWNPQEARDDFLRAAKLDSSLQTTVHKELKAIDRIQHERDLEDKKRLQALF